MVRTMVKIHGNWCGPNWTGGQNVSAKDYKGSWNAPAEDWLDRCCRTHDKSCADGGCTTAADRRMIKCIDKWYANPLNPVLHPIMNVKAQLVREGIRIASITRSN
jgi:hypothetical protein